MDKSSDGLSKTNAEVRAEDHLNAEIPSTSTGRGNHTSSFHSSQVYPTFILDVSSHNGENPSVGVKRKFEDNGNETRKFKRQRKYRYMHAERDRGEKRKFAFDHTEQPRKRFKSAPVELEQRELEKSNVLTKSSVQDNHFDSDFDEKSHTGSSSSMSNLKNTVILDVQPIAGTSGYNSKDESCALDTDKADGNNLCPASCVCNVGQSSLPQRIERYFDTPMPLRVSLLMLLSYSRANKNYTCCPSRCVRKLRRSTVRSTSLLHMTEDYDDQSDLRVHKYSWGEWKE